VCVCVCGGGGIESMVGQRRGRRWEGGRTTNIFEINDIWMNESSQDCDLSSDESLLRCGQVALTT
jgi:hypothetical protein